MAQALLFAGMSPALVDRLLRALLSLSLVFVVLLGAPAAFAACTAGSCNDGNPCTTDSCDTDTGTCVYANNTASCNDVNACTVGDTCSDGFCQGTPITCNDFNACTDDTCNPVIGCTYTKDDTNTCQDASVCTSGDHCSNGTCVGTPITCPDDGEVCTSSFCNAVTGCGQVANTAACDDGDGCTLNDRCSNGTCSPGTAKNCDDANACTTDSCDAASGQCTNDNNTNACDDGNVCTTGDACSDGNCQPGTPIVCDDANACTDDSCNPVSGCAYQADDTNTCSDGSVCTVADVCVGGVCVGQQVLCPDDGDVCTDAVCNPVTGCGQVDNTAPCDDGNLCTVNDHCASGTCESGTPKSCDDGEICTTDACTAESGLCTHAANTLPCDDASVCTVGDTCGGGTCQPGTPQVCDDANACTDDGCDPATGCTHENDDTNTCDDASLCTTGDHCTSGACNGTPVVCPDDDDVCTTAVCSPATGCGSTFNTAPCDDHDACTLSDVCASGTCQGGTPKNCDDGELCTTDTCTPATGDCDHAANTLACDDGNLCTTGDVCGGGTCQAGSPVTCDDANPCTDDVCTAPTGCGTTFNTAPCDDGNACTTVDQCAAGVCLGTTDVCAACPETPRDDCIAARPEGSTISLKDAAKATQDALAWKWQSAVALAPGDVGDPTTDTGLRLCVYDQTAGVSALALAVDLPPGGVCGRKPCWKPTKNGIGYKRAKDETGGATFRFKAGAKNAGFVLSATGSALAMPPLPLQKDPRVVVELHRTDAPVCWAARYATVKRPKPGVFKAVSE